jgi:hypothetical protein
LIINHYERKKKERQNQAHAIAIIDKKRNEGYLNGLLTFSTLFVAYLDFDLDLIAQ